MFCATCTHPAARLGYLITTAVGVVFAATIRSPDMRRRAVTEAQQRFPGAKLPPVPPEVGTAYFSMTAPHTPTGWLADHLARMNNWPPSGHCPRHGARAIGPAVIVAYRSGKQLHC